MSTPRETVEERDVRLLLTYPAYRRVTSLHGPRPTVSNREAFDESLARLREAARS